jgi:hypothetical protein
MKGKSEKTGEALGSVVKEHTVDEETRSFGGDLGYLRPKDPRIPSRLRAAVEKLEKIGDHTPPAEIDGRWIVFVKTGGRPAVRRSLDQARAHVRLQILADRRKQGVDELIEGLRGGARVEQKLLEQVSAPDERERQ